MRWYHLDLDNGKIIVEENGRILTDDEVNITYPQVVKFENGKELIRVEKDEEEEVTNGDIR